LEANKKSAQASRERKKMLKCTLEEQLGQLSLENSDLATQITELETENKVLKNEFIHLQQLISESPILSKLVARANMSFLPSLNLPSQPTSSNATPVVSSPTASTTNNIVVPTTPSPSSVATQNTNTDSSLSCKSVDDSSCSTNSTTQAAASMYLMIVLYTFSQYFSAMLPGAALSKPIQLSNPVVA
jgi:hypothetical protein